MGFTTSPACAMDVCQCLACHCGGPAVSGDRGLIGEEGKNSNVTSLRNRAVAKELAREPGF